MPGSRGLLEGRAVYRRVLSARIPPLPQCHLGFRAAKPRICQAHFRIGADREQLFLAGKAVLEPPELGAVGTDEDVEALTISKRKRPSRAVMEGAIVPQLPSEPKQWANGQSDDAGA